MATSTVSTSALTDVPDILKPYITGEKGVLPTAQEINALGYTTRYGIPLTNAGLAGTGRVAGLSPFQTDLEPLLKKQEVPLALRQGVTSVEAGIGALNKAQSGYDYNNIGDVTNNQLNPYQMNAAPNVAAQAATGYQMAGPQNVNAQNLNTYQMAGPDQYSGQNVSQYMNPYMQNVVDVQKQESLRDAQKQLVGANLASSRQGTYGGARNALMQSEANRNLQTQMGNIQATGSQQAFQNAQQQFNTSQQQQQAANAQNLQAALGVQQLGSGQSMQAQLANQAAQQGTNQTNLQALINQGQFGAGQNLQAQLANQGVQQGANQANLQASLNTQQLSSSQSMEAQKANQAAKLASAQGLGQVGAAYSQAGSTLGALGTAQQAANMDILKVKGAFGDLQRNIQQNQLDAQYNDLMARLNQPMADVETMNNLARGVPLTQTATSQISTTPPPSFASQLSGMGLTGLGLYNMFNNKS